MDRNHPLDHRRRVSQTPALSTRRNDLDWIRVAAFGLLILYHVALVYAPYDWHVHSAHTFGWLHEALLITNPWRLTLLFLVSGAALRLMATRRTPERTLRDRAERLIPPLLFGTVVLVPIQSWIEAIDKGGFNGTFIDWLVHEFGPTGLSNGVPVNHLWFIVYIAVYSLVAVALMTRPALMARLEGLLVRSTAGWRVLVVPIAYLIVIRIVLFPLFGITNRLSWDGYNHFLSLGAFLFGFLMVRHEELWAGLERHRRTAAIVALIALPIMMAQAAHPGGATWFGIPRAVVFGIDQWAVIAAILGYGSRYLRQASGPALRYLVDATFTLYLAHQTVLVVAVWFIRPANLPAALEAMALVGITFGVSLLIYEIVKRIPLIRPLWGLKPLPDTVVLPRYARRRRLLIVGMAAPLLALTAKGTLVPARVVDRLATWLAPLFWSPVVVLALVGLVIADVALLAVGDFWAAVDELFAAPAIALLIYALLTSSALVHELGHAAACRYGGARPGEIGFGLYLVFPAFYTDVTDSYRIGRAGRVRTDLGGLHFNVLTVLVLSLIHI